MKQKQFDFKRVFSCFFLTLAVLTLPAFAAEDFVFPEGNCRKCGMAGVLASTSVVPTCTNRGIAFYEKCSLCNLTIGSKPLPALGHVKAEIPSGIKPTCTNPAYVEYKCTRCNGIAETLVVGDPLGHDWIESSRVDATVDIPGSVGYSCSRCSETKTEIIPQLPAEPEPPSSESLSLTALLQTMTEVFSMACEWMEAVCFTIVSHPILLLGVVIGFIGTGAGLFQRLLNL